MENRTGAESTFLIASGTTAEPAITTKRYTTANNVVRHSWRGDARYQMTIPATAITAD